MPYLAKAVLVIVLIFAMALATLAFMPARMATDLLGLKGIVPLAGARLTDGRGLWLPPSGQFGVVRWQWCPSRGISTLCANVTGGGYFDIQLAPGVAGLTVKHLDFSGVSTRQLGLYGLPEQTRLGGKIDHLYLPWSNGCYHQALLTAAGDIVISGLPEGDITVGIQGDRRGGISLSGESLKGKLTMAGESVTGTVEMPGAFNAARQDTGTMKVNIKRRFPCRT